MPTLSRDEKNAIDAAAPINQTRAPGLLLSGIIQGIYDFFANSPFGSKARSYDIDAVSGQFGPGGFAVDEDNTVGLDFAYLAGRIRWNGKTIVNYAADAITLTASATNYVEADVNGTIYKNTAGFTDGRVPLFQILTGIDSISLTTNVTNKKVFLSANSPGGVTGDQLSQAGHTKSVSRDLGTLVIGSMPYTFYFSAPTGVDVLSKAVFHSHTGQTASDANYVTWTLTNLTKASAVQLKPTSGGTAPNTTKVTGGSAIVADAARALTLTDTTVDLDADGDDLYALTIAKTGTPPADLVGCGFRAEWTFAG